MTARYRPSQVMPRDLAEAVDALPHWFVIGGQAYPLEVFPGYETSSSFFDGVVAAYAPSLPEIALGLGGLAAAALVTLIGARIFAIVPGAEAKAPHAAAGH